MSKMVHCSKLGIEAEGLDTPPYPGDLGEKIYRSISKQAWSMWLEHQTMLINEYRLSMLDPEARKMLQQEMEKFLFSDEAEKPSAYTPPEEA